MSASKNQSWLHLGVIRLCRVHFVFIAAFALQTILHDTWHLIAPNAVLYRWILTAAMLVIATTVWYLAKNTVTSTNSYKGLVFIIILMDIVAASMLIYAQRGMASRAVFLYAIPIAASAVLRTRAALFATAALCVAAYVSTAVAYFVLNFNEGYKYELYSEVGVYAFMFFIIAAILWVAVRNTKPAKS
jgi:hypothetical protein